MELVHILLSCFLPISRCLLGLQADVFTASTSISLSLGEIPSLGLLLPDGIG